MNKKVLRWNFVFQYGYVITNIINSLILLPFYLHKIDAATLGVWLATGNILAWMTLVDPGLSEVLQQRIGELRGRGDNEEVEKTIGSGIVAASGILVLSIVAGVVFYFLIGIIINKDVTQYHNLQAALFISIVSTGLSLMQFSLSGINQGMQNASQVAICAIVANILFLVVNITLLLMGYGIISIAAANLARGLFINIYNFIALKYMLKSEDIRIVFLADHFKRFIKIFSFTSLSSIIGGLSASMDTIVLARFIPPAMITIFEINKRPIQLTSSLVGRHSVALMPVISHSVGKEDHKSIIELINIQFKYYAYAAMFIALLFSLTYPDLITAWTGKGRFAGNTIVYMMLGNFFFFLIGYFMSNIGYAVGDIKRNSVVNIIRGIITGILFYPAGQHFGIIGVLGVMMASYLLVETIYFSYRLYKLGYLKLEVIKSSLLRWVIIVPVTFAIYKLIDMAAGQVFTANNVIIRLIFNGGLGIIAFIAIVLVVDKQFREDLFSNVSSLTRSGTNKKNGQPEYKMVAEEI